jgi:hypothetical protein
VECERGKKIIGISWRKSINMDPRDYYSKVCGFALDFNMKEIAEEENKWSCRLQIFVQKSAWN